jgi:murein DD-endopeptidase MepM/ murein hydrolase activator NlpD
MPIVGGYSFGSGWNDIRDEGERYHHGVDVLANPGQLVVSPVKGVVVKIILDHPLANNGVVIRDADGYQWRIYHMSPDIPEDIVAGRNVSEGQLLGYVGSDQYIPHVHVELHQPNGVPVNPLWSLQSARQSYHKRYNNELT